MRVRVQLYDGCPENLVPPCAVSGPTEIDIRLGEFNERLTFACLSACRVSGVVVMDPDGTPVYSIPMWSSTFCCPGDTLNVDLRLEIDVPERLRPLVRSLLNEEPAGSVEEERRSLKNSLESLRRKTGNYWLDA
jgi:hypothetical protein